MNIQGRWFLTIAGALAATAPALAAQEGRVERDAFTWNGKIPEGRWITVRNMNGPIEIVPASGDRVEVNATRHVRRGDPNFVRFEVQKYGSGEQDVLICALWGENSVCDEDGYRSRSDRRSRENNISVSFVVRVPRGVKVGAHGVNGDVRVEGVTSEVDAGSVNGGVFVSTAGGPVSANTVNGTVRARMGKFDLRSDLRFTSVNGTVIAR